MIEVPAPHIEVDSTGGEISQDSFQPQKDATDYRSIKHKVKIDGKEIEIPYQELIDGFQYKKASQQRFEEASKMRKYVDNFVDGLKSGDVSLLKEFVPKEVLREFAEKELMDYIQWEQLPEYEKEKILAQQERDKYKNELDNLSKKEQERVFRQLEEQAAVEIDEEISDAIKELKKEIGLDLPVTHELVQDIARLMLSQLESGSETRMSARDATKKMWNRYNKKLGSFVSSLPVNELRKFLTSSQLSAIRKEDLETAMSGMKNKIQKSSDNSIRSKRKEKVSTEDFFKQMDKKYGS